jgi:hypothetical protein
MHVCEMAPHQASPHIPGQYAMIGRCDGYDTKGGCWRGCQGDLTVSMPDILPHSRSPPSESPPSPIVFIFDHLTTGPHISNNHNHVANFNILSHSIANTL